MTKLPIKKLGSLMAEAVELLVAACPEKDAGKLEHYVLKEADLARSLLGFLVILEVTGTDPKGREEVMKRGASLVGEWMRIRAEAVTLDKVERNNEIPVRAFTLQVGRKTQQLEGRFTQATLEALRVVNGLAGIADVLGGSVPAAVAQSLMESSELAWPPGEDASGGAVQTFRITKAAMAANPDLFWLFGGNLDAVLKATAARQASRDYVIPVTWGPMATLS